MQWNPAVYEIDGGFYNFDLKKLQAHFDLPALMVIEHIYLLEHADLIIISRQLLDGRFRVRGLTWQGHDFFDTVPDPEVWQRTKDDATKMRGRTLATLKDFGSA